MLADCGGFRQVCFAQSCPMAGIRAVGRRSAGPRQQTAGSIAPLLSSSVRRGLLGDRRGDLTCAPIRFLTSLDPRRMATPCRPEPACPVIPVYTKSRPRLFGSRRQSFQSPNIAPIGPIWMNCIFSEGSPRINQQSNHCEQKHRTKAVERMSTCLGFPRSLRQLRAFGRSRMFSSGPHV